MGPPASRTPPSRSCEGVKGQGGYTEWTTGLSGDCGRGPGEALRGKLGAEGEWLRAWPDGVVADTTDAPSPLST